MSVVPRNLHTKYKLNTNLDKGVMKVSLWLPWQPQLEMFIPDMDLM